MHLFGDEEGRLCCRNCADLQGKALFNITLYMTDFLCLQFIAISAAWQWEPQTAIP